MFGRSALLLSFSWASAAIATSRHPCAEVYQKIFNKASEDTGVSQIFFELEDPPDSSAAYLFYKQFLAQGAKGYFVKVFNGETRLVSKLALLIEQKPQKPHYGSAFEEIYDAAKSANIPVAFDFDAPPDVGGLVFIANALSDKSDAIVLLSPRPSNLANRHEYKHLKDLLLNRKDFLSTLPKLSKRFHEILNQNIAGDPQAWKKYLSLRKLTIAAAESRASWGSIRSLLNKEGFREAVIHSPDAEQEFNLALSEVINVVRADWQLLKSSLWVSPQDPKTYVVALRVGGEAALLVSVPTLLGTAFLKASWAMLVPLKEKIEEENFPPSKP